MHCVGMCGGFACAMGSDQRGHAATIQRHLIYNLGRVTTYCFIGALVGYLGMQMIHTSEGNTLTVAQRVLAGVSGVLMILVGLQFVGLLREGGKVLNGIGSQFLAQALRDLLKHPSPLAPLAFGVLNGFLPCPLVYAFAAQAAASGSPLPGFLIMAIFGLGTFPAMLAMGGVGIVFHFKPKQPAVQTIPLSQLRSNSISAWSRINWRVQSIRISGAFIVLLGLITFARGVLPVAMHGHSL